ncbi:MAG: hypothetical protein HYU99_07535, partial [Deltaproteobacteria bacterium]|nr:hypothetical protein [Deltaproteobacteria bacterium]
EGSEQVKAEDGLVPYRGWSHTLGGNVVYRPGSSGFEVFGGLGFRFENGAPNKVADLLRDDHKGIFDEATPEQDTSVEGGETSTYPCGADGDLEIEEGEVCEEGSEVSVDDATSDIDTSGETVEIGSFGLRVQAGVAYSFEAIPDTLIVRPEAAIFYGGGWYNGAEGHGQSFWDYAEYESRLIDFKSYTEPGVRLGVGAALDLGVVSDKLDNIALALNGGWNGSLRKVEGQYRQTGNFADPQHTFVSEWFIGPSVTVPLGGRGGSGAPATPAPVGPLGATAPQAPEAGDEAGSTQPAPGTERAPAGAETPPPGGE